MTDETVKKARVMHLRVTEDEYGQIAADADNARLSMSAYIRRRALGHAVTSSTDMMMIRELRRQGGLIKHAIVESDGVAAADAAKAYRAIVELIEKLSKQIDKRNET